MTKEKFKPLLPYIGLPVILTALLILRSNRIDPFILLLYSLLIIFGYIASVTDIKTKTISNKLILAMLAGWILIVIPQLFFDIESILLFLRDSLFGLLTGGGVPLFIYIISRKGLGGGDVKFMAVAGLYLGMIMILSALLYGSILAGLTGLILILTKKRGRKDTIPLAPFLYIGILLAVFFM
jgi:Flp pilus assembly protein protease CpaA